ncbi:MAG TPA: FAD:protein FMN transferase [Vicinamibacterales bacterium]|nr:FAD:protein FMN transferase [Vicinamibacterales bacterium]
MSSMFPAYSVRASAIVALLAIGCAGERTPQLVEQSRLSMGSQLRVAVWSTDSARAAESIDQVFSEFDRLEALLSVWKHGSDVVRLNANAGITPVTVSDDTINVLRAAAEGSELTRGKFDITFGALTDIWRFDHDQDNIVPDRALIEARLTRIDYRAVETDRTARTAFINRPGVRVHLGGIGKGYAVDRAIALLRARGFTDFLIQSGGDLYVAGTNGGAPWTLAIADPRGAHDPFARVQLSDATLSTSGDYERAFLRNGKRYHHLLDPDYGEPAGGCRSVTIVASRATLADILSTGVFLLGPDAGMALIERLPDVEGVIVTADNEVLVSSGLRDRIEIIKQPTNAP